jgi:transcriptional regulator with XRE-family HTH domain
VKRLKFNPRALYDAVDAERRNRGMTWASLSRELHVSTATIKNLPKHRRALELDGVIALACWVGRTVESFAGGKGGPSQAPGSYGKAGRFDTAALYRSVSDERTRRGLTWNQVRREIWPGRMTGEGQLKGMSRGGRSNVYTALAICEWLGRPIRSFQREPRS